MKLLCVSVDEQFTFVSERKKRYNATFKCAGGKATVLLWDLPEAPAIGDELRADFQIVHAGVAVEVEADRGRIGLVKDHDGARV